MNEPTLLTAARARLLASQTVADLVTAGSIGTTSNVAWINLSVNPRDGLPWTVALNKASVSLFTTGRDWTRSASSARNPRLGVAVFVQGEPAKNEPEWLARHVAELLALELDDPAHAKPKQWSEAVYVNSCRYAGDLGSFEIPEQLGLYRSEVTLELQLV